MATIYIKNENKIYLVNIFYILDFEVNLLLDKRIY